MGFAKTPVPPYWAVIFTSQRAASERGYNAAAKRMMELASKQQGCLGAETVRDPNGFGINVSYWIDEKSIASWKAHAEHLVAQRQGKEHWYDYYEIRVARVERAYSGPVGR